MAATPDIVLTDDAVKIVGPTMLTGTLSIGLGAIEVLFGHIEVDGGYIRLKSSYLDIDGVDIAKEISELREHVQNLAAWVRYLDQGNEAGPIRIGATIDEYLTTPPPQNFQVGGGRPAPSDQPSGPIVIHREDSGPTKPIKPTEPTKPVGPEDVRGGI